MGSQTSAGFHPTNTIFPNPPSSEIVQGSTRRSKMKLSSALGLALVLAIVLLLVIPEAESKSIRPHRGALARRAMGMARGQGRREGERTDAGAAVRTKSPRLTWCRMTEDLEMEGMSARFSCSIVGTGLTA